MCEPGSAYTKNIHSIVNRNITWLLIHIKNISVHINHMITYGLAVILWCFPMVDILVFHVLFVEFCHSYSRYVCLVRIKGFSFHSAVTYQDTDPFHTNVPNLYDKMNFWWLSKCIILSHSV